MTRAGDRESSLFVVGQLPAVTRCCAFENPFSFPARTRMVLIAWSQRIRRRVVAMETASSLVSAEFLDSTEQLGKGQPFE
jgi:hypothetical protein